MVRAPYTHTLNAEDVETGSILIEKAAWDAFPPPMEEFAVAVGGRRYATRIVAEDCICRGKPHQHYHLEAGHFRDQLDFVRGNVVSIQQLDDGYVIANR